MPEKAQIYTVFFGKPAQKQGWPYQGFDCESRAQQLFQQLEQQCPQLEFKGGDLITTSEPEIGAEQIEKIKRQRKNADGCLYYLLALPPFEVPQQVLEGKPAVLDNDLYGGDLAFLNSLDLVKRKGLPVIPVSCSGNEDLKRALGVLSGVSKLADSKALIIREVKQQPDQAHKWKEDWNKYLQLAQQKLGVEIKFKQLDNLLNLYHSIDEEQAEQVAQQWVDQAQQVVEPSSEEIVNSARMYLAIKEMITKEQASAFTMDCLDLFYRSASPVLPCLAYSQLLDEGLNKGLVGTCEADLDSLLVQLIGQYLTKRPGFISDPVLDSEKNQIIYAHCVAPTKVQGEQGKTHPSVIRSHSESGESAARQVIYPEREPMTTVGLNLLEQKMVIHQGKIVDNIDTRRGCRTKVAVETDVNTILDNWDYQTFGWHRVSFCGDFRKQFKRIATVLGLELIEEDRRNVSRETPFKG